MPLLRFVLPYAHGEEDLRRAVLQQAGADVPYRILKRSIDARQHRSIRVEYTVSTDAGDPAQTLRDRIARRRALLDRHFGAGPRPRAVVVGSGPGGLFAAFWLQQHGLAPVLLEQGPPLRQRLRDMAAFIKTGVLHPESNICFGAGGAGTYSDGKLMTRIRSPFIPFIMATLVDAGADEAIRYLANPHLGSNHIRRCIDALLRRLAGGGAECRFGARVDELRRDGNGRVTAVLTGGGGAVEADALFLATGHSARRVYAMLRRHGIAMDVKEFAVGLRVEHRAAVINEIRYGRNYRALYPDIETATYRVAQTWKDPHRAVFSFCMCPGGHVLNASTEPGGVVTNGMSNARSSGRFSNAAVVVNVTREDLAREGFDGIDGALLFQAELERRFAAAVNPAGGSHIVPAQRLADFLAGTPGRAPGAASCAHPIAPASLHTLLPPFVREALVRGFAVFDRKMPGFTGSSDAQLFGVESRTSSPYRIERDPVLHTSPSASNLYPIGEGAGFAGGITSAAVDGIRCAEAWIASFIGQDAFGGGDPEDEDGGAES
jgi:uncharacterized protein